MHKLKQEQEQEREQEREPVTESAIENNDNKNNIKYTCDWKRVCGVDQIRRVVEHLGENLLT